MNDSLEEALRQMDPGPPPSDMAARCIAALPETQRPNPFAWLLGNTTRRRLMFSAAGLILVALWATWPALRKDGTTQAPASAFARTVEAMGRITAWYSKSRQIGIEPGDGKKKKFAYYFKSGWIETHEWFDADHGNYMKYVSPDGVSRQWELMRTNGDWLFRQADPDRGRDKVRITHMGEPWWRKTRDERLKNLRNPAMMANNFDRPATDPPTKRSGNWKGTPAIVFTFDVAPSEYYKASDPPTKRTEFYVDPNTRLIIARQEFARWLNHPERGEHITWIQEFTYSPQDTATLFDSKRFCEGTKEIQEQAGGPGVVLDPQ